MGAVYVRISHDDDFMVAQLTDIKIIMYSCTKSRNHSLDLCICINLIHSGFFYV